MLVIGAFTATVVKVTRTEGHVWRGGCNHEWPPVYTRNFLEFLSICSSHLHVHVAEGDSDFFITVCFIYFLNPLSSPSSFSLFSLLSFLLLAHTGLSSFLGDFLSLYKAPRVQVCDVSLLFVHMYFVCLGYMYLCTVCVYVHVANIPIGASLSKPHTSVTALHTCVCMYVCLLACGHIPKI